MPSVPTTTRGFNDLVVWASGRGPLAAVIRVDRTVEQFKRRVLSGLAQLRGEPRDVREPDAED